MRGPWCTRRSPTIFRTPCRTSCVRRATISSGRARARRRRGAHNPKYGTSQSLLHTFSAPSSFSASWRRRGESTLKACASNGSRASSAAYNREFMALEFAGSADVLDGGARAARCVARRPRSSSPRSSSPRRTNSLVVALDGGRPIASLGETRAPVHGGRLRLDRRVSALAARRAGVPRARAIVPRHG